MSERSIVELLQQGNVTVLTALLDRLFHPHSMTANLEKRDRVLQIAIASHPRLPDLNFCVPDRQGLAAILHRLLLVLDVQTVDSVSLSWQRSDLERSEQLEGLEGQADRAWYAWSTEFNLFNPKTTPETGNEANPNLNPAIQSKQATGLSTLATKVEMDSKSPSQILSDCADQASEKCDRLILAESDLPAFPSSSGAPLVVATESSPVSYVIKPATIGADRSSETDRNLAAPSNNYFGSQLVQFVAASVIMVGLFVGIHFAINANKPAKNNSSSALTNEVLL